MLVEKAHTHSSGCITHSSAQRDSRAATANDMKFEANSISADSSTYLLAHILTYIRGLNHTSEKDRKIRLKQRHNTRSNKNNDTKPKRHTTNVLATHSLRMCVCLCAVHVASFLNTHCCIYTMWPLKVSVFCFCRRASIVNEHNKAPRMQCNIYIVQTLLCV